MNKERAKEYLIKSKLYRFLALVFACLGVLLFCYTYFEQSEGGNIFNLLRNPVSIVFLIFPFVPAIALSVMARRAERKLSEFLKET
ncbi:MAG: hypothetical protein KA155_04835 [Alphaproteobacteria bacterium]|jgi:hypothetical protein|nr:hypothetical protein [Alphaproteobacteria bacterium]